MKTLRNYTLLTSAIALLASINSAGSDSPMLKQSHGLSLNNI
tara:strand:- start:5946 stop:6071 length:126 start_codon:yes stop_codon:yes gene_type:complete